MLCSAKWAPLRRSNLAPFQVVYRTRPTRRHRADGWGGASVPIVRPQHAREAFGPAIVGLDARDQPAVDTALRAADGMPDFHRLGANAAVALSLAVARAAAAQVYRDGAYHLERTDSGPRRLGAAGMVDLVDGWAARYPLVSVEDALAEDDWEGWRGLTARLGDRLQLVGDDLFTTDAARVRRGVAAGVANAVLVKVNQVGTLTAALETLRVARAAGYRIVVSARSGETEDDWLADVAIGSGAGQIKVGSVARSERLSKYNRLLRVEEEGGVALPYGCG